MKLGVLFSGGKDSTLALLKAKEDNEITCLITLKSKNEASYMFHTPNINLTRLQSIAMNLPLIEQVTEGKKEEELEDLKRAIIRAKKQYGIEGVVTGAIRSVYQATRVQRICKELDLWCFNPLWLINQVELLNETISNDFKTIISGVAAYPFTKDFLGKEINNEMIKRLESFKDEYLINPAGEGGEIETTVIDCPLFTKKIKIIDSEVLYNNYSGVFFIKKAELVSK